ncbi:MAG: hypothetical protein A2666_03360 [Parcubacteria group bacterium RIFCSPHIGHO2_01_FULL_47_10b]|nr:MAG: hypothetical protein A2666_03360 [Parcubacteria group bacterium RIFCSPHIGHO2_01_FULL_47_10b]
MGFVNCSLQYEQRSTRTCINILWIFDNSNDLSSRNVKTVPCKDVEFLISVFCKIYQQNTKRCLITSFCTTGSITPTEQIDELEMNQYSAAVDKSRKRLPFYTL